MPVAVNSRRGPLASVERRPAAIDLNYVTKEYWLNRKRLFHPREIGQVFTSTGVGMAQKADGTYVSFGAAGRANKVTVYNANPTDLTGISGSAFSAGRVSLIDDTTELFKSGLSSVCTSGKVFRCDNSDGATTVYVNINGATSNTNTHTWSIYARRITGSIGGYLAGNTGQQVIAGTAYARFSGTGVPLNTTYGMFLAVQAGAVVHFILPQVEEASFASEVIVTTGAAASAPYADARITDQGLLSEEPRTSISRFSNDPAQWLKTDCTVTSDSTLGPDGKSGNWLVAQGTAGTSNISSLSVFAITVGTKTTGSYVVKRGNHDWFLIGLSDNVSITAFAWFNLATGTLGAAVGGGGGTVDATKIEPLSNGWYRLSVTGTLGSSSSGVSCRCYGVTANGVTTRVSGGTRYMWHEQVDLNAAYPTSPVMTTTANVTRPADSSTLAGLSAILGNQPHTLLVEFGAMTTTVNQVYLTANATQSPGNTYSGLRFNGGNFVCPIRENGLGIGSDDVSGPSANVAASVNKFALRRRPYENSASINGQPVTTKVTALNPVLAHLCIGHFSGSSWCNTYIRRVRILMGDLTDAQLRALTAV